MSRNDPPSAGRGGKTNRPPRGGASGNRGGHRGGNVTGNPGPQGGPRKPPRTGGSGSVRGPKGKAKSSDGCAVMALALGGGLLAAVAAAGYGLLEIGKALL